MSAVSRTGWLRGVRLYTTSSTAVTNISGNTTVYPEILDLSKEAKEEREHQVEVAYMRALPTVEEKIFRLNMPKYYGWKCILAEGNATPLGCLPLVQHITRTHLVKTPALPDPYMHLDAAASYAASQLRPALEDAITLEYQQLRRNLDFSHDTHTPLEVLEEDAKSRWIIEKINRVITNHLASSVSHIMDSQMDIEPRHESFWFAGGFPNPKMTVQNKRDNEKIKIINHPIQYIGEPVLTLRSSAPLEPLLPYSEAFNDALEVPVFSYHPTTVLFSHKYRHATNIPGFWPGDSHEFGLLSYMTRAQLAKFQSTYPADYVDKSLDAQGIINSFGWLMAQASYQGFSTYNDITYPLVTQTVVTNGQYWSLFAYQMNTVLTHGKHYETNRKRNICYSVGPVKLFEGIDDNGRLVGFNDDVLKMLLQLYMNAPAERVGVDMKPYLGSDVKVIADIQDDQKRIWLEKYYKNLVSNRPRHKLEDEIYHWEWIYKIMFNRRFGDNTRRFFEVPDGKGPSHKRLDDHFPQYVPKAKRAEGFKGHVKWEKTYYPSG